MNKFFNDYRDFSLVYIDNILVFSETAQAHRNSLIHVHILSLRKWIRNNIDISLKGLYFISSISETFLYHIPHKGPLIN